MTRELKPCGTIAAYMRHRKAGQKPCDPCRLAWNTYQNERRQDPDVRAALREQNRPSTTARRRAMAELVRRHRAEFLTILAEERAKLRAGQSEQAEAFAEFEEAS